MLTATRHFTAADSGLQQYDRRDRDDTARDGDAADSGNWQCRERPL
jgi:hypothetical protein